MKRCSRCKRELPLDAFHVDTGHADGRASVCKKCRALWVASRKSEVTMYNAQYYARNRDRRLSEIRAYQQRHPEIQVRYRHRYRARKFQASGEHTLMDLKQIFRDQEGKCFYCGRDHEVASEGHFDHVIPLARGGSDNPDNIVFACRACNWSKHDKTLDEWIHSDQ